ncbi:hypothetical protein [Pseudoxanthomonas mexicana]
MYNVDIGSMQSPSSIKNEVEEYAAKLDWNINEDHRLSARFSKLEQIEPTLAGSSNRMNYNSHNVATFGPALGLNSRWYDITKEVETSVVQLFSDWRRHLLHRVQGGSPHLRLPEHGVFAPAAGRDHLRRER